MANDMAPGAGGGSGDTGGETDSGNTGNNNGGDSGGLGSDAASFLTAPVENVRNIVFGMLLSGIAWFVEPVFNAVELVFAGSQPATFGAPDETWGLADLPVVLARLAGDTAGGLVETLLSLVATLINDLTLAVPGPFDGIIATAAIVAAVVGLVRYGPLVLIVVLEAIPGIGPPLASLLRGAD